MAEVSSRCYQVPR